MAYTLPELPYPTNALEPTIDAKTMEIHHGKHHNAYVTNLNKALEAAPDLAALPIEELCAKITAVPEASRAAVRNNGGGHYNHSLFWTLMKKGGSQPSGPLADAIKRDFGNLDAFKEAFAKAGVGRFGSGWVWLVAKAGKLSICSTANQDNPLMGDAVAGCSGTPIMALDVWEHAYYLNYQNRRPDYITAFWAVANWDRAGELFSKAK
jgi:Fe-Mn family superoxide dismutase